MQTAKRVRIVKQKTKTFTGCWTCRARKVKCDSHRPNCTRCTKGGFQCEGFGIKLYWVTGNDTGPPTAIKRHAMRLESSWIPTFSSTEEVDQVIQDIDQLKFLDSNADTFCRGPFAVFPCPVDQYIPCQQQGFNNGTGEPESITEGTRDGVPDPKSVVSHEDLLEDRDIELVWNYNSAASNLNLAIMPTPNIRVPMKDILSFDEEEEIELVGRDSTHDCYDWVSQPSLSTRMGTLIYQHPIAGKLMSNYIQNIADLLQPIKHYRNTYSSIYVPSAMAASSDLLLGMRGTDTIRASNIAIFYSLLATSAFHLRGPGETEKGSQLDFLGRGFRAKAFTYLRKAIRETSTTAPSQTTMAGMLSLVTADVMEGSMSEYWIHLSGVNEIAGSLPVGRLHTVFTFLTTLSNTTSFDLPHLPWSPTDNLLSPAAALPDISQVEDHSLEFTYGITSTLASFMRITTTLSQHIAYYKAFKMSLPLSLRTACLNLGSLITSWDIDSEPLLSMSSCTLPTLLIAKQHMHAFHHALQIYYHTLVNECTPAQMQDLITKVASDLESIEIIKQTHHYDSQLTAPITWPGFIAACEAAPDQRGIWRHWWEGMLKYRIGNIAHLWRIVKDVWAARDEGDRETPAWMGVLRRGRKRILAV